jgi:ABC-type phosphate transport system substrate-binding protein
MRPLSAIGLTLAFALTTICGSLLAQSRPNPPAYVIIVNPNNPATSADRKFLEDAFLKKTTRWPNDEVVRPADLAPNSPVRRKFTEDVLQRSVDAVKGYWQQRIFSGRDVPPPEFETDDDVVKFVLKHDGGLGYVSGSANLNGSKALGVR